MKRIRIVFLAVCALILLAAEEAFAFPVDSLPEDNLIINPWFHSRSNRAVASLEGWTQELNDGLGWGLSDKEQNPSPYGEIGTAARWAERDGVVYPNIDVVISQVVKADAAHRKLKFSTWWVSHRLDLLEFTVFGGNSETGPWETAWIPFSITVTEVVKPPRGGTKDDLYENTGILETIIEEGYPYYKVEVRARLPEPRVDTGSQGVGVKITGVYFATEFTEALPTLTASPTVQPTDTPGMTPTKPQAVPAAETPTLVPSDLPADVTSADRFTGTPVQSPDDPPEPPGSTPVAANVLTRTEEGPSDSLGDVFIGYILGVATTGAVFLIIWKIRAGKPG